MANYPWYSQVESFEDIQQGDFVPNCPIVIPPKSVHASEEVIEITVNTVDSIIMTQSCDLSNRKIQLVLVCPYYSLTSFIQKLHPDNNKKVQRSTVDNLKKGNLPSYHLLNKDDGISFLNDYQVVDFRNVYGIHIEALQELVTLICPRHRLEPPFREHLSQAFARYFMRVGLPQDLDLKDYI